MLPKITKDAVEIFISRLDTDKDYIVKNFRQISEDDPQLFKIVVELSRASEYAFVQEGFLRGAFAVYTLLVLQEEIEEVDNLWDMDRPLGSGTT